MQKFSATNLMYNKTQLLEYELEKRLAKIPPQDLKKKFKDVYAESVKAVDSFIQKRKEEPKKKKPKKDITTSTFVVVYRIIDPLQVKNYPKTAKDNQGNTYGQISSRHYNIKGDIRNYEGRTYRTQKNRWDNLLKKLKTNQSFTDDWDSLTQSSEADLIVIVGPTLLMKVQKVHKPLDEDLFAEGQKAIFNKLITYDLNRAAKKFGELFKIEVHPYVLNNFKANSCYVNLILDTYYDQFEKKKKDGKRMYSALTYDRLCAIIGVENKNQDIGLSIRNSLKFFEKFCLGLDVINVFGEILISYRPKALNKHINPQVLRILIHNGHSYKLDNNLEKKFEQLNTKKLINWDEVSNLKVSNKYQMRAIGKEFEVHYIKSIDECVEIIKQTDKNYVKFITTEDLSKLLFQMTDQYYIPNINFSGNRILSLSFVIGDVFATIEGSDITAPDDNIITIGDADMYSKYHKIDDTFYEKVIDVSLKSDYPECVRQVEKSYPIGPLSGFLTDEYPQGEFNAIDKRKAYTECLMEIDQVPVFGYFDRYQKYDNHPIEDLTMYIVEVKDDLILFQSVISRCYGFKLKEAKSKYKVHYFRRPSKIIGVDYKQPVDELYATDLHIDHKKYIVNKTTGLMEKPFNKAHISKVFNNRAEAQFYQIKYGGSIHAIPRNDKEVIYILVIEKKEELIDGFRQIKEIIYDKMSIKINQLYQSAVAKKLKIVGIKTDCILIRDSLYKVEGMFDFTDRIGGYKFEKDKTCKNRKITQEQNTLIPIHEVKVNEIKCRDEYNITELKDQRVILIKGLFPGVGKTTAVKNYDGGCKLFVTPFNKLAQELRKSGHNAITLNMLLGIYVDGKEYTKGSKYDVSSYDTICFDEVMLYSPNELKKIDQFINSHPDKKFFGTGDLDQLQPFNVPNNIKDVKQYILSCINSVFPNQITLKINKRLKTEEDKQKLKNLKTDIFDKSKDIIATLKKYGFKIINKMEQLTTKNNICYFNFRADRVNRFVHNNLVKHPEETTKIKGVKYWKDLELVCKKHYKQKNGRLYVNYTYKIKDINNETFTVVDEVENKTLKLKVPYLDHFKLPYSGTCHSYQGLSIDDKITIFDCNVPHTDRHFVWTAITRATDLKNITIFEHNEVEVEALLKSKIKMYFTQKISCYKMQDQRAGRQWDDEQYITTDWIAEQWRALPTKCCPECRCPFEKYLDDNKIVKTNITVDRLDNRKGHIMDNCRLLCVKCNITKH